MDNSELYFQSINHEEDLALGRNREHFLHKQICTRFQPFREYFLSQAVGIIRQPRPEYSPWRSVTLRDNMKVERQVKYIKSTVLDDYGQEVLEELLGEETYQPIKRLKNISVIYDGKYYWAEHTKLKYLIISDFLGRVKLQANKQVWSAGCATAVDVLDIHEWIYELTVHGALFYVRTPRKLIVIDPSEERVVKEYPAQGEIVNFHHYDSREGERMILTTYEDRISQIYEQKLDGQHKMQLWCKIDGLINALWTITDSQVLICKENAILLADRRKKAIIDLHRRSQCHKNRIYSGLSLESTLFGPRYFVTTESKTVNIYDIRKPYEPVLKINHYCEEAPPSVLQIWNNALPTISKELDESDFDAFVTQSLKYQTHNPILIAHSPYASGSSLFTQLSIDSSSPQQILKKQVLGETNQFSNKFQLLYDPGKLFQNYHPRSITPISLDTQLGFLHLDNYNGISLEIFQKMPMNQNIKGYKRINCDEIYQRVDFMKQEAVEELKDPNMQWYANYMVEKQLESQEEDFWAETMEEDELQLQENQFQKKVIRYADLKKFYHQVQEQSKAYPLSEKLKEQTSHIRFQPQPPSQSQASNPFSQPQTQASESLSQTLTCTLSQSSLLSLLQEWNPRDP